MKKYPYIFKLHIIGGLALVEKGVECDYYELKNETYMFMSRDKNYCDGIIAQYPVVNTIIHSIDDNPDYEGAPRPNRPAVLGSNREITQAQIDDLMARVRNMD